MLQEKVFANFLKAGTCSLSFSSANAVKCYFDVELEEPGEHCLENYVKSDLISRTRRKTAYQTMPQLSFAINVRLFI